MNVSRMVICDRRVDTSNRSRSSRREGSVGVMSAMLGARKLDGSTVRGADGPNFGEPPQQDHVVNCLNSGITAPCNLDNDPSSGTCRTSRRGKHSISSGIGDSLGGVKPGFRNFTRFFVVPLESAESWIMMLACRRRKSVK